jgi:hypothetical protein
MMGNEKMGICADTHVSMWHGPASKEDVERLWREAAGLLDQGTGNIFLLLIVEKKSAGLSPAPVRDLAMAMVRDLADRLGGVAIVVEGEGIRRVAVRAVFTGLGLILRPGFPWKMFVDVDAATEWLTSGHTLSSAPQLRQTVAALRRSQ